MPGFAYTTWDTLLAAVVTPEGKVDYDRLLDERALLERFIEQLAAASPDSRPELFAGHDDTLAYWLNAYNAFTLHAIAAEYPITSVWKTREGRFFGLRNHDAGGERLSLDDIEHEILRQGFADPRIHFAINCGSAGCPPLHPDAFRGEGLGETLRRASEAFLASEWNCRFDHPSRRVHVSRIFRMYGEDFAGATGTREDYRRGVLRFVAEHTAIDPAAIADYEVVYNTYDWGLNDSHREATIGPITFHEPSERFSAGDDELRELHLYEGSFCNRACSWCTINGSPQGWYEPYSPALLDRALATLAMDGNLKFYGGEPTLHTPEIVAAIAHVRARGFRGLITVFSNGIQADKLVRILEADDHSEAVLNYSIFHGRDAEALPAHARARLEDWARAHPGRLFKGYKVLFHAGAGAGMRFERDREADFHGLGTGCVRCFPVLTTRGRFHACPFAVEIDAPHLDLGPASSEPGAVYPAYRRFLDWVDEVLDPAARARGISSCEMCHGHLAELPPPQTVQR